jgi:uncharacterized protein YmfQ (DUF2313 family)
MGFYDLLKGLLPKGPYSDDDASVVLRSLNVKAQGLERAKENGASLLQEMRPETALYTLSDWERICGLKPSADDPIQTRRARIVQKLNEKGGLSRQYYTDLAALLGYTVTVEELRPFMAGIDHAGDRIFVVETLSMWRVRVLDSGAKYVSFRAGSSASGERVLWWPSDSYLEDLFNKLKRATTIVVFEYA